MRISKLFLASAFALLLWAGSVVSVEAAVKLKYPKGAILREEGTTDLYYYANDGKKYLFPNTATYKTWYVSVSRAKDLSAKEFKSVPLGGKILTVRPGVKPVKFVGFDKYYVVASGNVLREVKDEALLRDFYGENWSKKVVKLPADDIVNYELGKLVSSTIDYSPSAQKKYASTINKILPDMAAPIKVSINTKPTAEEKRLPILRSLKENLDAGFKPGFKTDVTGYSLLAGADEDVINLSPVPANPDAKVFVNNWPVKKGFGFSSYLNFGVNNIAVKVVLPNKDEMTYRLVVNRQNPDKENRLKSISENLAGSISPKFSPDQQYYTLHANYGEQILRLKASAKSKNAKVYIRGEEIKSGKSYAVNLATDKTLVDIYVLSQDENLRKYTVEITRDLYPNLSEARLKSLTMSGAKIFFDSASSDYFLTVPYTTTKTTISAAPINSDAIVKIDNEVSRSRSIELMPGDNRIQVAVQSPNGYSSVYYLNIKREVEKTQ